MSWTEEDTKKAMEAIMSKASTDAEFRKSALADPNAAIEAAVGKPFPEGVTVRFVENEGATFTFVLPDLVPEGAVLSDSELEQVAGGRRGDTGASAGICIG